MKTGPIRLLDVEKRIAEGRINAQYHRRTCGTKIPFLSELEALRTLTKLPDPEYMHAYRCNYCKAWHIGHRTKAQILALCGETKGEQRSKLDGARDHYKSLRLKLTSHHTSDIKREKYEAILTALIDKYTMEALEGE